jgi:drug/metabolite transporter (DMT)-like permease
VPVLDTVLLALAASLCWGIADFTAGLEARTVALPTVLLFAQGVGLALALPIVALSGRPFPAAAPALAALGAGVAVITGLACFYRALAAGTMSVVAPIAATGVAIPVLVGVLGGDHLALIQAFGMLAALLGVVLASRHPGADATAADRRSHRNALGLAMVAAVAFGCYFLCAHVGARGGVAWLLVLAHITSVLGVLAIGSFAAVSARAKAARHGRPVSSTRRALAVGDLGLLGLAGLLDFAATGLYGIANRHGLLSVVAVAGSLYPVATVLLARTVLRERVARSQALGVGLALVGVALIAA